MPSLWAAVRNRQWTAVTGRPEHFRTGRVSRSSASASSERRAGCYAYEHSRRCVFCIMCRGAEYFCMHQLSMISAPTLAHTAEWWTIASSAISLRGALAVLHSTRHFDGEVKHWPIERGDGRFARRLAAAAGTQSVQPPRAGNGGEVPGIPVVPSQSARYSVAAA